MASTSAPFALVFSEAAIGSNSLRRAAPRHCTEQVCPRIGRFRVNDVSHTLQIPMCFIRSSLMPDINKGEKILDTDKVHKVMSEFKRGELHSHSKKGPLVKSRKQAIAIALSEAGMSKDAKKEVPDKDDDEDKSVSKKVEMKGSKKGEPDKKKMAEKPKSREDYEWELAGPLSDSDVVLNTRGWDCSETRRDKFGRVSSTLSGKKKKTERDKFGRLKETRERDSAVGPTENEDSWEGVLIVTQGKRDAWSPEARRAALEARKRMAAEHGEINVPKTHKLYGKKNLTYFKHVPVGHEFSANQWYSGKTFRFVKRDPKTGTDKEVYLMHGHEPRSWMGRTSFRSRDIVVYHGPSHNSTKDSRTHVKMTKEDSAHPFRKHGWIKEDSAVIEVFDAAVPTFEVTEATVYDEITIDDKADVRFTDDGFLVATPRVARTGIQLYRGSECKRPDMDIVRVYRPADSVFASDAMHSFAHRPVTIEHPPAPITADNWKKHAVGQTGDEIIRDGDAIRVPMVLMDKAAIAAYKDGKNQLSMGYTCDLIWKPGVTPSGEKYDAIQTAIKANHLAVVDNARGGSQLTIGDTKVSSASVSGPSIVLNTDAWSEEARRASAVARKRKVGLRASFVPQDIHQHLVSKGFSTSGESNGVARYSKGSTHYSMSKFSGGWAQTKGRLSATRYADVPRKRQITTIGSEEDFRKHIGMDSL